ncbi:MAG: ABC transporter substrate-binding protein [Pseudomonadota bacterium]
MNSTLLAARKLGLTVFLLGALLTSITSRANAALTVGYSDWPGWVAWEVAIEKDWFAEAGIDVTFEWFDYVASMDAFAAGQLDGVLMTNGDTLVTGATGAIGTMIIIGDYSNGNDMLVGGPGIETVADLKGKKVGVEVGFVGHLLLLNALEDAGLTEDDIELVNVPTNETPQVLASGDVSAIVAWQPNSGQALSLVAGSKALYTSADKPGLIYDVLAVSPQSLAESRDEWSTLVDVWYRVVDFINSDDTKDEALSIMSARVGLSPEEYAPFLEGTRLLTLNEAKSFFTEAAGFDSLWGSTKISDDFNLKYQVYTEAQDLESYIDASLTVEK